MNFELSDKDYAAIADQLRSKEDVVGPMRNILQERIKLLASAAVSEHFTKLLLGMTISEVIQAELTSLLEKECKGTIQSEVFKALNNQDIQARIHKIIVDEARANRRRELEALEQSND